MNMWIPASWRHKKIEQNIIYSDSEQLLKVEEQLATYPPLVFAGEVRQLKNCLKNVINAKAFVLQGGDCAESFEDFSASSIRDNFRILLQMAIILGFKTSLSIVKIGRVAGQFAKPRSQLFEKQHNIILNSYRGDIVNSVNFDQNSRHFDPERMYRAYVQSASTLNLLRAFAKGGYADLHRVHHWNLDFIKTSTQYLEYEKLTAQIDKSLSFMNSIGINSNNTLQIRETDFYTSHEALLLNYEQAFTRQDSTTSRVQDNYNGDWYNCSAHMLWLGERTRNLMGAHVEFLRGIQNPIGIKISHKISSNELLELINILNPNNESGKIMIIVRMGYNNILKYLPNLLKQIKIENKNVIWCLDPMHGNTIITKNMYKTRYFEHILLEIKYFFHILKQEHIHPGGIHLEYTGKNVIECLNTNECSEEKKLTKDFYKTLCDPRLNATQALELAFQICQLWE